MVAALAERGHEPTVLCAEDRAPGWADVPVHVLPQLAGRTWSASARGALRDVGRGARPDVVLALTARQRGALAGLLELAPLVRFVQDHTLFCPGLNKLHEDGRPCERPMGLACLQHYLLAEGCTSFKPAVFRTPLGPYRVLREKLAELELHRRAARLLVSSRYMRDELLRVGFGPDDVVVCPYFTRTGERAPRGPLEPDLAAFLDAPGAPLVLAPARLVLPDKGVDHLLTALGKLREPFRAVIPGDGPARAWLERKAREEGLADRVRFPGWLAEPQIEELYARADVVAFPSVWNEPFGLIGLEAMAHAKPVAAFAVGGVPEWLADGETGLLAPRRDTDALAAALDRLLADRALRERLGRAGRERLQREFSLERHLAILEPVLARAAGLSAALPTS